MATSDNSQATDSVDKGQRAINDVIAALVQLKARFVRAPAPQNGGPKALTLTQADMDELAALCDALEGAKLPPEQARLCLTRSDLELIFLAMGSALVESGGGRVGPGSTPVVPGSNN